SPPDHAVCSCQQSEQLSPPTRERLRGSNRRLIPHGIKVAHLISQSPPRQGVRPMSNPTAPNSTAVADRPGTTSTVPAPEQPTSRRWPWVAVFALVAAGLGGAAWFYFTRPQPDESQLVLQGNIDVRQVNLAFKVEGRIETLAVDEGDAVTAGQ